MAAVWIPEGATAIGSKAFSGCSRLEVIYIPYTVTSIADDAFDSCSSSLIIAGETEYVREYALEHGFLFAETGGNG